MSRRSNPLPRTLGAVIVALSCLLAGGLVMVVHGASPDHASAAPRNGLIAFDAEGDIWVSEHDGTGRASDVPRTGRRSDHPPSG